MASFHGGAAGRGARASARATLLALACGLLPGAARAVDAQLGWIGDFGAVVEGGLREGERHLGLVELALDHVFDVGTREVGVHASGQHVYGGGWSSGWVGDLQAVSNVDADPGTHLLEAWVEVPVDESLSVRFGRYDFNGEFDVVEAGGLFLHSSQGIGAEIAQTGVAGPSIFPRTSLALRVEYAFGEDARARGVALDLEPARGAGDRDAPFFEGPMVALEVERGTGPRRWKAGAWGFTHSRPRLLEPGRREREYGAYASVEQRFGDHWVGYARVGAANERVSRLGTYLGAGLVHEGGLLADRGDVVGLAVAHARNGDDWRRQLRRERLAPEAAETAIELTWRVPFGEHLVLQPDLQYVLDPDTDPSIDDALVLMLRVELAF